MTENTPLTSRETEILALIAEGKTNKEIAADLFIIVNTVKVHVSNVFQKIGFSSRTEATLYAIENGIVQSPATLTPNQNSPTIDFPGRTPEETIVEKSGWLMKNWWIMLGVLVLIFAITQITQPSLSILRSTPTPNAFVEALNQNRMEAIQPMARSRIGFASVINEGEIYIIGGRSDTSTLGLTERYLIDSDSWESLPER